MAKDHGERIGRSVGCRKCGRKRGMIRRHGLRLCRQCFRAVSYTHLTLPTKRIV